MPKPKPCVICGAPKRPAHPLYCQNHWLLKQPTMTQVHEAEAARAAMLKRAGDEPIKRPSKETWPEGHIWCQGCFRFRIPDFFGKGSTQCKPCASRKSHASMVQRTYGISGEEWDALYRRQGGKCAICMSRQLMRRLAVHHDHNTNEVVALCCKTCNKDLLGAAHDSAYILLRAYALQLGGLDLVEAVAAKGPQAIIDFTEATE